MIGGRGEGLVGGEGRAAGGRLKPLLGLLKLAMRTRSTMATIGPTCLEGLTDLSLPLGSISDPSLP